MRVTAKLWQVVLAAAPSRHRWLLSALGRRRRLGELPSLLRGYYPEIEALLDGEPRDYLDERSRETRTGKLNGQASIFLDDKLAFHLAMPHDTVPELLAVVIDGRTTTTDGQPIVPEELFERVARAVVRPIDGKKGRGLFFVDRTGTGFEVNGELVTADGLTGMMSKLRYHIVTRYVEQHPFAQRIFPNAVNTLRLVMMRNPDTGTPFLALAFHRFGTSRSAPVDSWSRGGIANVVDLTSGTLGPGLVDPHGGELDWMSHHPETGAPIEGEQIPDWDQLVDYMLDTMRAMPMIRYVGWDVVQTQGGPLVIEGNNLPDLPQFQMSGHRPFSGANMSDNL